MKYDIRDATPDHFDALAGFLDAHLAGDYFITHEHLKHVLEGRYHETILAVGDDGILGVAIMTKTCRTLVNLLVAPDSRKRGIGDALLATMQVERVRAKLDVMAGDPRDFYRSRGFRSSGRFNGKGNIEILVVDLESPPEWAHFACCELMPLFSDLP